MEPPTKAPTGRSETWPYRGDFHAKVFPSLLALTIICSLPLGYAQERRKYKVPVVDKISGGNARQAFSGKIQSLDLGRNVLNVNTVQGGNTEIFPLRKGIRVATAAGEKMKLQKLTPGTNVIVYYDQKGERRTVKEIIVLGANPGETKKSAPPS